MFHLLSRFLDRPRGELGSTFGGGSRLFKPAPHFIELILRALQLPPRRGQLSLRGGELPPRVAQLAPRSVPLTTHPADLHVFALALLQRLLRRCLRTAGFLSLAEQRLLLPLCLTQVPPRVLQLAAQPVEFSPHFAQRVVLPLHCLGSLVGAELRLAQLRCRLLRGTCILLRGRGGEVARALHLRRLLVRLLQHGARALELLAGLALHLLRQCGGIVPVVDLLHQLLHLGGALVCRRREQVFGLTRLALRHVQAAHRCRQLLRRPAQLGGESGALLLALLRVLLCRLELL
mmetsp:Transcript_27729/g.69497  ORF Transcript_27729/g.69497 Transcript_27729/m.69497 type:complete len:290 (-) Transcript_27729:459-1328(-)